FVIVYGQGEQSAFLLPSFLMFSFFAGYTLIFVVEILIKFLTSYLPYTKQDIPRTSLYVLRFAPLVLLLMLIPFLILPQIRHNITWLSIKWNRNIYNEWGTTLNHPLELGAGMLAHWGDLTPFWYMQHAEGYRPDLRGIYPPDENIVINWFERGNPDMYIAGPLQGWAAGIEERYQLVPWGRLVRIAPRHVDPRSLLPDLPQVVETTFSDTLHLLHADYAPQ
ncbi:MAG: hypothetical protein GY807_18445, partial [Gammaproteobacteria bacterium]|nr:hypothetical protein [Gammaproteobacteria bacterium]